MRAGAAAARGGLAVATRAATAPGAAATREGAEMRGRSLGGLGRAAGGGLAPDTALDVAHLEVAAVGGAGLDHHAWAGQVADDAGLVGQAHALGGGDVADHHAGDEDDVGLDVRLDDGPVLDRQRRGQRHPALDPALYQDVLFAPDFADDAGLGTDDGLLLVSHGA